MSSKVVKAQLVQAALDRLSELSQVEMKNEAERVQAVRLVKAVLDAGEGDQLLARIVPK